MSAEDRAALEAHIKKVQDDYLSRYEVTRQGIVQKESESFVVYTSKVTPEVTSSTPSLESVQSMIDAALDRQARVSSELMPRLLEERDSKRAADNHVNTSSSTGGFRITHTDNHLSGTSAGGIP